MVPTQNKAMTIAGWILTGLIAVFLGSGAVNALRGAQFVLEGLIHVGYPPSVLVPIGLVELICVVLYVIPSTTVLGAVLLTGYFGGAVASHVRIGERQWVAAFVFGVVAWLGVWLRKPAVRRVLPIVQPNP